MKRGKTTGPVLDIRPLVKHLGWQEILRQTGLADLATQLTSEQRRAILTQTGLDDFIGQLSPEQRQELLERLQEQPPPERTGRKRKS